MKLISQQWIKSKGWHIFQGGHIPELLRAGVCCGSEFIWASVSSFCSPSHRTLTLEKQTNNCQQINVFSVFWLTENHWLMEDECSSRLQQGKRGDAVWWGARREEEEAGPPFLAGVSCQLGLATLPLNCPLTKCLPWNHVYSHFPLPCLCGCAGGMGQAVLPAVGPAELRGPCLLCPLPPPTVPGGYTCSCSWGTTWFRSNLTQQKHCLSLAAGK